MSTPGDQKPPDSGKSQKPPHREVDQTLPEGAFDQTMSEDVFENAPAEPVGDKTLPEGAFDRTLPEGAFEEPGVADDSATMIGDEPSGAAEGATMVGDDSAAPEDGATMLSDEGALPASGDDFGKTLQADALAESGPEEDDFGGRTMMLDSGAAEPASAVDDDYGKTMQDGAPDDSAADSADTDKTMVGADSAAGDDFGKTIQVDSFSATMNDDGDTLPREDFDGKTIVGTDSAAEPEVAPPPSKIPLGRTIATSNEAKSRGAQFQSQGTRAGGLTSAHGTEVGEANSVDGIEKDDLNVAVRQITGLSYGRIPRADFKLVKVLGEGGMGVVYVAKQQSLGREVVFKTLKPMPDAQASKLKASGTFNSVIKHRSDMFLSEAVVTADLFHPNIIPIYELAEAPDGSMFYTMKWVRGDGWHNRMKDMTLEENIDVLMKVSDAMAFAHSRHIVNRDLKPENVMIGGFGETIVLDWGLALPFGEGKGRLPLATTAGLGSGTPAYMPPELITGPLNKIGPACDIYLLGAMLFEVVTGKPPHDFVATQSKTQSAGAKMAEIRRVVVDNVIRQTEFSGELIDIAKKAMATKPEDRYLTVVDLQNAIREYQRHAASRSLVERAKEFTTVAAPVTTESKPAADAPALGYANYQNALALYNESLREWPSNSLAREGLTETQLHFAKLALTKGDFDLGLSVLDTNAASHTATRTQLEKAREEREGRVRMMKYLKIAAGVLVSAVMVLLLVAANFSINLKAAQVALETAKDETAKAEIAKSDAEADKKAADLAAAKAKEDRDQANIAKLAADEAKKAAQAETVAAQQLLDVAKKETVTAKKLADDAKVQLIDATKQKEDAEKAKSAAEIAATEANIAKLKADEGQKKASYLAGLAAANRFVQEGRYPEARKKLEELKAEKFDKYRKQEWEQLWNTANAPQAVSFSKPVESISISRDGRKLVAGDSTGHIVVWPVDALGKLIEEPLRRLELGSRQRVVAMSPDGNWIAAAGDSGKILVWSLAGDQKPIELQGHDKAVNTLKFGDDGRRLVSGGDDRTVKLWSIAEAQVLVSEKVMYSVQCVDWSRDGKFLVAGTSSAGDSSGVAYAWEVQTRDNAWQLETMRTFQVPPVGTVKKDRGVLTIALTDDGEFAVSNGPAAELYLWRIDTRSRKDPKKAQIVDFESQMFGLHSSRVERVRSVSFSSDSSRMLAAGDDGTITIWDRSESVGLPKYTRTLTLSGHGGPVRRALLLPQLPGLVVSGSYDQNVHVWDLKTYLATRLWMEDPSKAKSDEDPQPTALLPRSVTPDPFGVGRNDTAPRRRARPEFALASFPQAENKEPAPPNNPNVGAMKSVQIVTGHTDSVLSAVFSRDGTRVLSASRDQTARAWKSDNGQPIATVIGPAAIFNDNIFAEGHEYDLFAMRFFPDGKRLLTSGFDGTMRIWDSRIDEANSFGRELVALPDTGVYGVVEISRDGEWIVTAGRKNSAQVWNTPNVLNSRRPQPEFVLNDQHRYRVTAVAIAPDSSRLLTADREGQIVFWDTKSGKVIGRKRNSHSGEVVKAEFLGDGSQLLTAGVDRRVVLWNIVETDAGLELRRVRQFDHEGMVVSLAVSSLGDRFLSVSRRGDKGSPKAVASQPKTKVTLWTIDSGKQQVVELTSPSASSSGSESTRTPVPAWSANGKTAVVTTPDGSIHFYDSDANRVTSSLRVDNSEGAAARAQPYAAILRPDEPTPLHLLTQTHNAAFLWRIKDGTNLVNFRPQGPVFSAGYSSDGRFVVTGGRSVRIFDGNEGLITFARPLHKIEYPHEGLVTSVEFSPAPGSYRFLTTSYDETAKIWEWDPNRKIVRMIHELKGHVGPVRCGVWSADGSRVLTVGRDAQPRVWSFPAEGPPQAQMLELPKPLAGNAVAAADNADDSVSRFDQLCGAFSWDGRFVTVGGQDRDTRESIGWTWNLAPAVGRPPQVHATIRGHGLGGINSVSFLPDDERLLTGGADGTARLWDWQKDAILAETDPPLAADFLISLVRRNEVTTHNGAVTSVRVARSGNMVTASSDGTVLIWPK